jgi:hypothetical protein
MRNSGELAKRNYLEKAKNLPATVPAMRKTGQLRNDPGAKDGQRNKVTRSG